MAAIARNLPLPEWPPGLAELADRCGSAVAEDFVAEYGGKFMNCVGTEGIDLDAAKHIIGERGHRAIYDAVKDMNISNCIQPQPWFVPQCRDRKVVALWNEGYSVKEIVALAAASRGAIYRYLRKANEKKNG